MWEVRSQDPKTGQTVGVGEEYANQWQARKVARELALTQPNTTFYVHDRGRVPAVYHYAKTVK